MRFIIPPFTMNNQHVTQTIRHGLLNETEHHFAALFHRLAQKIQARLLRIFTTAQLIQHPMLQPFPPKLQRLT